MDWRFAPSEVLFSAGSVTIYWYGIFAALGIAACYAVFLYFAKRSGISAKHSDRLFILGLIGGTIGARVLYVLYHLDYFRAIPSEIPALWHGGWVWHGGIIGVALVILLYCRISRIPLLPIADALAPGLLLGQAIGRLGNYFNQEAYGPPTSLPWGILIDPAHRLPGYELATHFHPAFAYEMPFDLLLFALLFFLAKQALVRKRITIQTGSIIFAYIFLYSIGRFGIEFFRIDTVPVWFGLRAPQWISICLILLSGALLLRKSKKMV